MAAGIQFGRAFGPNPVAELASAVGGAVANMPNQEAQLQQVGQQLLAPYKQQAAADPNLASDPSFMAKVTAISKRYGLPIPMMGTQGGSWDAVQSAGQAPPQTPGGASPQSPQTSAAGASGTSPGRQSMPFGKPSAAAAPGPFTDDMAQGQGNPSQAVQAYNTLLQQAAADPGKLRDGNFHVQLVKAAAAVGRNAQQIKADVQGAIQHSKAGTAPNAQAGHPTDPNAGAQGAPGGPAAQPAGQPSASQPAPPAGPQPAATTGAPDGMTSPMRPETEGPMRINLNAWLGRTLSSQDMGMLAQMQPANRKETLRQMGYDARDFSPSWLNADPSLDPSHQLSLANDVAKTLNEAFKNGDSVDQVKTLIAPYMSMLTPEQRAGINAEAADQMNGALQIRLQKVQQDGLLRGRTLDLMNRRLTDSESNTQWDHNFKYQVFNQKTAEWSASFQQAQQRVGLEAQRLQNEINGGGQPKIGELINSARGLLSQINTGVNEYNTRLQASITAGTINPKDPSKGVNPNMEGDIQNSIEAYNNIVTSLRNRGFTAFNFYSGPDQSSMDRNSAQFTAKGAANSQGLSTPGNAQAPAPASLVSAARQHFGAKYSGTQQINGQWYVKLTDGSMVPAKQ